MIGLKLKTKIIISVISIITFFGIFATIFVFKFSVKSLTFVQEQNLSISTKNHSDEIDQLFLNSQRLVKNISNISEIKDYFNNTENQKIQDEKILKILNDFNIGGLYSAIYLMNSEGVVFVSTKESFVNKNYSFRPYYKEGMLGRDHTMMAIGSTSKKPGYYFSSPIKDEEGVILGVAIIKMPANVMDNLLVEKQKNNKNNIMIADKNGVIIFSNKKDKVYKSLSLLSARELEKIKKEKIFKSIEIKSLNYKRALEIIQNYVGVETYSFFDEDDGEKETITVAQIGSNPFFLISEVYSENLEQIAIDNGGIISLLVLLSALISVFVIIFFINNFLKPLPKLEEMTKQIGIGNFDQKNIITTKDEFYNLGLLLESVAKQLKYSYSELEHKVKTRTKEIEEKNALLEQNKKAILNILEDVESEQKVTNQLAKDLEKFKLAVDSTSEHVVIADKEGVIIYTNKAVSKLTGYKVKEVIGKKIQELWCGFVKDKYCLDLWDKIKVKKVFIGEIKNKRKNGESYDAKIHVSSIFDDNKEIKFYVILASDISKEKAIDKAKTEFVSLASHQLRTPLSAINWYAEMLLSKDAGRLNKAQSEYIKEIYKGNQRMVALVNSLLNVSRVELGTFIVEPKMVDLKDMIDEIVKEMKPKIKQKKIKFTEKFPSKLQKINLDPKLIQIVIQNLLSNAVKYTASNGSVDLKVVKKGKNVILSISDTGYGIPEKEQSKIFTKLYRADNVRSRETEGTGLGLYIVKMILDYTGGDVWFTSKENKGTTFYASIPLKGMKVKKGTRKLT